MTNFPNPLSVREIKLLTRDGGDTFAAILLLRRSTSKAAKNGNLFLSLELGDKTGSFNLNVFGDHPNFEALTNLKEGRILRIEAKVKYYQDQLSPHLLRAETITLNQFSGSPLLSSLIEIAPEDAGALWVELQEHIEAIQQPELRATVQGVFDDVGEAFRIAPAAVSMHHAYRHGLLEHTVHIARATQVLLPLYPETHGDLALAGVLTHDVGKALEYESEFVAAKSRRGILQGHVVLGYQLVRKAGLKAKLANDLLERLEHIVLSHQGELEWGAAVIASTPEAVFVAKVDDLDAKMGMVQRLLRQALEGSEFSARHAGLNTQLLLAKPSA